VSICNRNRIMTGLRFLFRVTLRRLDLSGEIYHIREPQKIPLVMSPDETQRLLAVASNLKVRTLLSLGYGCGLRASEVVRLKVKHIDSAQKIIRVGQQLERTGRDLGLSRYRRPRCRQCRGPSRQRHQLPRLILAAACRCRPLRYIDLMSARKTYLLVDICNNLGAETKIYYAPSTKFDLADRAAGRPWVTRLSFPVQVVEKVETFDWVSRNLFVTRYSYHHGYFDGFEEGEFEGDSSTEEVAAQIRLCGADPVQLRAQEIDEAAKNPDCRAA